MQMTVKLLSEYNEHKVSHTEEMFFLYPAVAATVPHKTMEDIEMGDYILPKNSFVLFNLDSVHVDESQWGEDALEFRPQRWIDESGDLKRFPAFMPFSAGMMIILILLVL